MLSSASLLSFVLLLLPALAFPPQSPPPTAEFRPLVARIVQQRIDTGESDFSLESRALSILDALVLSSLNAPVPATLPDLNSRLAALAGPQPALGESYRLLRLPGPVPAYALLVNFSLSGPSAVRLYTSADGPLALAARIDSATFPEFVDEYLEILPLETPDAAVFVTVSGRTDSLSTGVFSAWLLSAGKLQPLWASEFLEQSSYSATGKLFQIDFCAAADPDNPRSCTQRSRYRFAWEAGQWKRLEGPAPSPAR